METQEPNWLTAYKERTVAGPTPTRWRPGQSGNPKGRTPGSKNRKTLIMDELEKDGDELVNLIKDKARAGDSSCLALWLSRIEPPVRPSPKRVEFALDPDASIADQGKQVVLAVSRGEIDPDTAKAVMDMLGAYVGLRDVETFLDELKRLRESKRGRIPGGVLST